MTIISYQNKLFLTIFLLLLLFFIELYKNIIFKCAIKKREFTNPTTDSLISLHTIETTERSIEFEYNNFVEKQKVIQTEN